MYYFHNNDAPKVFIGSADWMRRNLDDRVAAGLGGNELSLLRYRSNLLGADLRITDQIRVG